MDTSSMKADELRRAFTGFFVARGHTLVPSMGLIPHHPAAPMFANAGMNQFLPVILGEEPVPDPPRATSVQKCLRVKGKHDDIANVGVTWGHCTFFEMLGNFSFGDYFKAEVIPWAWELLTDVLEMDGDRLWVTVHDTDEEAAAIWRDAVGLPAERIQAMGADNFWEMGETGPCGPSSEIYFDRGEAHGAPGGPAHGGEERFREIWNLVFMQYNRRADGSLGPLPLRIIDTGAGLERMLTVLQDVNSVFETDELARLVAAAEQVTGRRLGDDPKGDVSLRVLADHARTVTFMVADGQTPSNEDRGYVLRRILRRAVRHAFGLGVEGPVLPKMVEAVVEVMGPTYPELRAAVGDIVGVVAREEERFHRTLRSGSAILDEELSRAASAGGTLSGSVAFRLHDTYGFPLELTLEVAAERDVTVDREGFEAAMDAQRRLGQQAAASGGAGVPADAEERRAAYRSILDANGPVRFTGYQEQESTATVTAVIGDEIFLDRTPFYAEGGGQVGDTGTITGPTGRAQVLDTTYAMPGLHRHTVRILEGEITPGQEVTATVDADRRERIRRNHTGTHLLHWALREVLGRHVKQAGSLVAPERLRFDFSHFEAVTPEQLDQVETLANAQVLANDPVKAREMSKHEAEQLGAIAFFGEKYGDVVRVVEAGPRSVELCGGTHVGALGTIGPIKIVSESSIGANLRRIEAVTGTASLDRIRDEERTLGRTATLLRVPVPEVPQRVERLLDDNRSLADEVKGLRRQGAGGRAREMAAEAVEGVVVARVDGTTRDELKDLAVAVRDQPGIRAAVLGGAPDGGGVALVAAVAKDSGLDASKLIVDAARTVGGGGGRGADVAVAGGRDPAKLDEALDQARRAAEAAGGGAGDP
ncbi:MAG TPA: alanine--tRNA ligase [Acidimicrobiales bacterium]|nr:alanine--tRNA ligase [Acidimicrobiales bacterium]